jgi:hypothetical protein
MFDWMIRFAHPFGNAPNLRFNRRKFCSSFQRKLDVARGAENVRIDDPEGVSEANHPVPFGFKVAGFQLSLE